MTEQNQDIKFPEACPVCGTKERLIAQTLQKLRDEDKLSKEAFLQGAALQIPLVDPGRIMKIMTPTIKIYTLVIFYDICANPECGAFYVTGIQVIEQQGQVKQGPQPPGGPDLKGGRVGPF